MSSDGSNPLVLPVTLKLTKSLALVVGGGTVAARRVQWLLACGAEIEVIAPEICAEVVALVGERGRLRQEKWSGRDLVDIGAVIAATNDREVNSAVSAAAQAAGVPVNVVDDPELSTFFVPALFQRGRLRISIDTGGAYPAISGRVRADLSERYPEWFEEFLDALIVLRGEIRNEVAELETRSLVLRHLASPAIETRCRDLRGDSLREELRRAADAFLAGTGSNPGMVWLVGAGPGDPGLLTIKGRHCLGAAEVVIYDGLVNPTILELARVDARLVDGSKRAACKKMSQDDINKLMVAEARVGNRVCRLKGGDPFVFGKGGEEARYLADHEVRFEVVPGVSSAIGAAAYAGIPITHREHASSFQVVTGHEAADKTESRVDWRGIADSPGTTVFLMGAGRLTAVARRLLDEGKAPDTPMALVCRGTLPDQEVLVTTLGEAAAGGIAPEWQGKRPALIVVGEVVRLRESLKWFGPDR